MLRTSYAYSPRDRLVLLLFRDLLIHANQSLVNSAKTCPVAIDIFHSILNMDPTDALEDFLEERGVADTMAILGLGLGATVHDDSPSAVSHSLPSFESLTGLTRLDYAIRYSPQDAVFLLQQGEDATRGFPLLYAINHSRTGLIKPLLDAGADVHAKGGRGWTVLHYTCWRGNYDGLQELVRWADDEIDWNSRTPDGRSAVDFVYANFSSGVLDSDGVRAFLSILHPRIHLEEETTETAVNMPGAFHIDC